MCNYCHSYPHLAGCPNAPEPASICDCKRCREPIFIGDEYYDFQGDCYCEECFEDIAVKLMLENDYVAKKTAEEVN